MTKNYSLAFFALLFLSACSTMAPYPKRMVHSLNIGVLNEDARANEFVRHYFTLDSDSSRLPPNQVRYLGAAELEKELLNGNIDVAIGLPTTANVSKERLWSTHNIDLRHYHFLTRANDPKQLHRYHLVESILKNSQSIGYISAGSEGEINHRIVNSFPKKYAFVPCGKRLTCLNSLRENKIDALFGERHSPQVTSINPSKTLIRSRVRQEMAFGFLINQRTVTYDEFREINQQISKFLGIYLANQLDREAQAAN